MRTYTHTLATPHGAMVGYGYPTHAGHTAATWTKRAKNIALFFAAPFIGLAYLLAFPVIGLALALWIGYKAAMKNKTVRNVALAAVAPVIALAFLTVGPVLGLGALAWAGGKALVAG